MLTFWRYCGWLSGSQETIEPQAGRGAMIRMSMVPALVALALALSGCDADIAPDARAGDAQDRAAAGSPVGEPDGGAFFIPCALEGAEIFDSTCTVERRRTDDAVLLAVIHPDGGFRRFEQLPEGAGLAAVAGADAVAQTLAGDTLEIALAGNRYRFPAARQ